MGNGWVWNGMRQERCGVVVAAGGISGEEWRKVRECGSERKSNISGRMRSMRVK